MAHTCIEHPHEQAEGLCRKCGAPHCADCLVYPFGPTQPPYCVPCAVEASGLRANAAKRPMVVPKENKRRLKEWRKARKRDLESPPPDGVATWQRMDEADTEAEEEAAAAKAAAEREALRLPPPVPETPTPPPGINLAPPGPRDEDWRNELGQEQDEPLLGFLADDEPPRPLLEPEPVPTDPVDLPPPSTGEFGMGSDPRFAPLEEPTPLAVPDEPYRPPAYEPTPFESDPVPASTSYRPPAYEPTEPAEPPSYEPEPFLPAPSFEPHETTSNTDPRPYEPEPFQPPSYQPTEPAAYEPPTYEPPAPEPAPFEPAAYDPPAAEPTPFQPQPFEPTPTHQPAPVAFEPPVDPLAASFGGPPPTVDPADAPPLPPATSLADFGLGPVPDQPPTMAFADDPVPPPPAMTEPLPPLPDPTPEAAASPAASDAMPRPTAPELANAPIRPRTPTRIPAAKPNEPKGDAKAMLARIAALRSEKE